MPNGMCLLRFRISPISNLDPRFLRDHGKHNAYKFIVPISRHRHRQGEATAVRFHVTVLSLDTIDEGSMINSVKNLLQSERVAMRNR
ncbi:hypothetical protein CEXT_532221 [Caerostris extrusa]|uniref:Uncharacterized protein n=1 Tax=Caerostris extrusa TaxID=172846 RepID=A0AAV4STK0_CAEEX|nr:hypothetical protein CEXT_532221 [Caerostris extrusa]